ncbi:Probable ribonuclease FitB [Oligella ureolytica]|jgi:predicted nucleic acid-binding protein|uniref:type II toxin-antitoxin system VapC family toxin n=1 Tax=Oligella ureolytica TaxID=90244 RepID=UPI000DFF4E15|nr:type II toxin-antitoxin system VapC family toxin [Oligella ureolytica]NLB31575.1 type II toxin-antitoxin system VapC family toxin [Alcaligenaceae bacterium]SUA56998.1 Probable ribonuclease FitB [Oligella ureolytica]
MYLLDTNVISEMRKVATGRANLGLCEWASRQEASWFHISVVTAMELERGILSVERRDTQQGKLLRRWLEQVVRRQFGDKTLFIDDITAEICASLHVPNRCPENDAWIAAQAIQHNLTLVTRNEKDFIGLGIKLINPFSE